jgi:hypothetical protein
LEDIEKCKYLPLTPISHEFIYTLSFSSEFPFIHILNKIYPLISEQIKEKQFSNRYTKGNSTYYKFYHNDEVYFYSYYYSRQDQDKKTINYIKQKLRKDFNFPNRFYIKKYPVFNSQGFTLTFNVGKGKTTISVSGKKGTMKVDRESIIHEVKEFLKSYDVKLDNCEEELKNQIY